VSYAVEGVFVRVGQEVVQVEVRSPGERSAFARGVLAAWVKRAVE
jgi:hypothetical protein